MDFTWLNWYFHFFYYIFTIVCFITLCFTIKSAPCGDGTHCRLWPWDIVRNLSKFLSPHWVYRSNLRSFCLLSPGVLHFAIVVKFSIKSLLWAQIRHNKPLIHTLSFSSEFFLLKTGFKRTLKPHTSQTWNTEDASEPIITGTLIWGTICKLTVAANILGLLFIYRFVIYSVMILNFKQNIC